MSLSHPFWQVNTDLARACLERPFVRGIGDGSLSCSPFIWYVGQETFYLRTFARVHV